LPFAALLLPTAVALVPVALAAGPQAKALVPLAVSVLAGLVTQTVACRHHRPRRERRSDRQR
jgi:Cu/Ag efflux pump CusA